MIIQERKIHISEQNLWPLTNATLGVYSQVRYLGSSSSKENAAKVTAKNNTGVYLLNDFIFTNLHTSELPGDTRIDTGLASSPYGHAGLMIKVSNNERLERTGKKRHPIERITHYPSEAQIEYAKHLLIGIRSLEETLLPDESIEDSRAVATMNAYYDVSNEQHRMPQSIVLPHAHISKVNKNWLIPGRPEFNQNARTEERILRNHNFMEKVTDQVAQHIEEYLGPGSEHLDFAVRAKPPYGYEIATGITRDMDEQESAVSLARLIAADEQANAEVASRLREAFIENSIQKRLRREKTTKAKKYAGKSDNEIREIMRKKLEEKLLPQPSNKKYIFYGDDGRLRLTISNGMLDGSVGPLETAGIYLERDPKYDHPYKKDEEGIDHITPFNNKVTQKLKDLHTDSTPIFEANK